MGGDRGREGGGEDERGRGRREERRERGEEKGERKRRGAHEDLGELVEAAGHGDLEHAEVGEHAGLASEGLAGTGEGVIVLDEALNELELLGELGEDQDQEEGDEDEDGEQKVDLEKMRLVVVRMGMMVKTGKRRRGGRGGRPSRRP